MNILRYVHNNLTSIDDQYHKSYRFYFLSETASSFHPSFQVYPRSGEEPTCLHIVSSYITYGKSNSPHFLLSPSTVLYIPMVGTFTASQVLDTTSSTHPMSTVKQCILNSWEYYHDCLVLLLKCT